MGEDFTIRKKGGGSSSISGDGMSAYEKSAMRDRTRADYGSIYKGGSGGGGGGRSDPINLPKQTRWPCPQCKQSGDLTCTNCNGKGDQPGCDPCHDLGLVLCGTCRGDKQVLHVTTRVWKYASTTIESDSEGEALFLKGKEPPASGGLVLRDAAIDAAIPQPPSGLDAPSQERFRAALLDAQARRTAWVKNSGDSAWDVHSEVRVHPQTAFAAAYHDGHIDRECAILATGNPSAWTLTFNETPMRDAPNTRRRFAWALAAVQLLAGLAWLAQTYTNPGGCTMDPPRSMEDAGDPHRTRIPLAGDLTAELPTGPLAREVSEARKRPGELDKVPR